VSFLELFYDLVYVVVVAQAGRHLATHVSWVGVLDFAFVFGLVWIAWVNGAIYHELHGRADGRTRTFVFLQMILLAILAIFTEQATGADGAQFAAGYFAFLVVLTYLWYSVRRQDDETFRPLTTPYLVGMMVSAVVVGASVFVPSGVRTSMWGFLVVGWVVLVILLGRSVNEQSALVASESMIERFDLFTIIVLGEVVAGVVSGANDVTRTPRVIVTAVIALAIGFAYWWTYFDFAGDRPVRDGRGPFAAWVLGHLPVTMGIAASGAAAVGLIEASGESRTPAPVAWLLASSVAVSLLALIVIMASLQDRARLARVYQPLSVALVVGAAVILATAMLRPTPWLLATLLVAALLAVWLFAILRWTATTAPDEPIPTLERG